MTIVIPDSLYFSPVFAVTEIIAVANLPNASLKAAFAEILADGIHSELLSTAMFWRR